MKIGKLEVWKMTYLPQLKGFSLPHNVCLVHLAPSHPRSWVSTASFIFDILVTGFHCSFISSSSSPSSRIKSINMVNMIIIKVVTLFQDHRHERHLVHQNHDNDQIIRIMIMVILFIRMGILMNILTYLVRHLMVTLLPFFTTTLPSAGSLTTCPS